MEHAVITVPAYFNEHQRKATIQAGRIAGLTVNRILTSRRQRPLLTASMRPTRTR